MNDRPKKTVHRAEWMVEIVFLHSMEDYFGEKCLTLNDDLTNLNCEKQILMKYVSFSGYTRIFFIKLHFSSTFLNILDGLLREKIWRLS